MSLCHVFLILNDKLTQSNEHKPQIWLEKPIGTALDLGFM